jgi:hypothetical protein
MQPVIGKLVWIGIEFSLLYNVIHGLGGRERIKTLRLGFLT